MDLEATTQPQMNSLSTNFCPVINSSMRNLLYFLCSDFGCGLGYVIFSLVRIPAFLKEIFKDVGAVPSL